MILLLIPFIVIILLLFLLSFRFPKTAIKSLNFLYVLFNLVTFLLLLSVINGDVVFLHILSNVMKEDLKVGSFHIPRWMIDNYLFSIFIIYLLSLAAFYWTFRLARHYKKKRYAKSF